MNRKIKKEVRQLIKEAQINGQTSKEIYSKLVQEYDDEEIIARLIVTTVKPKDKKKHRLYNAILLGFTAIVVLFNVWIIRKGTNSFLWYNQNDYLSNKAFFFLFWSQTGQFVFFYIIILFNSILRRTITSYIFWMYSCSYLVFHFLFLNILEMWTTYWMYIPIPIDILSIAFIIFLARFFQRKIFPDYRYLRLEQDEDGEYIFS